MIDDDEYCPPAPRIPAHAGLVRVLSAQQDPRLHVESGLLLGPRPGRERLVWLVYLRPAPRSARILEFQPRR
jgi:hypothetical protein